MKLKVQERVKQRFSVKASWMVTAGLAVKWDYTGTEMGRTVPTAEHYLTASASLLPNQNNVIQDTPAPCWTGDLQPTR